MMTDNIFLNSAKVYQIGEIFIMRRQRIFGIYRFKFIINGFIGSLTSIVVGIGHRNQNILLLL